MAAVAHPYFPRDLPIEGYQDNLLTVPQIVSPFFGATAVVLGLSWFAARHLPLGQRLHVCWFVTTALIHICVEGPFVLYDTFYQNKDPNAFMLELWKEYGKADSRYPGRDAYIVSVETCAAFVLGPLCLLAAYGFLTRAPWRWASSALVSIMQLYGTVMYYLTCHIDDWEHSRPEPLYFWFMFVFMNGIWIVIPAICSWDALVKMTRAVSKTEVSSKKLQ